MYKTNIVKAALYLRPPHPFPAPPYIPPLACSLLCASTILLRLIIRARVYMCAQGVTETVENGSKRLYSQKNLKHLRIYGQIEPRVDRNLISQLSPSLNFFLLP